MTHLIGDRFLPLSSRTIDCATGQDVDVTIHRAGERADQQRWGESCAKRLADPGSRLIDYGFIGSDRRFEASTQARRAPIVETDTTSHAVEWLEHTHHASPRIFVMPAAGALSIALPRDLRVRGFVSVHLAMLDDSHVMPALASALSGRSVVLLHAEPSSSKVALGFLQLLSWHARHSWAIVGSRCSGKGGTPRTYASHAAEGRATFDGPGRGRASTPPSSVPSAGAPRNAGIPIVGDARALAILDEARGALSRGRHAAAERSLRAALAAFDRRRDAIHAGHTAWLLGRLLQDRGHPADAVQLFQQAAGNYTSRGAAALAIQACTSAGLAQTDGALFGAAEAGLHAAYSAASALADKHLQLTAAVALARCLFWQSRYADAAQLLETLTPQDDDDAAARYWCVVARLQAAGDNLCGAWAAVTKAHDTAKRGDAAMESTVRTCAAIVQAKLGDVESLESHVGHGLRAATLAHLPLQAVRLRLTLLEGLLDAQRSTRARAVGDRLKAVARIQLPPLLARRLGRALERLAAPAAHEAAAVFAVSGRSVPTYGDIGGLAELLSLCHNGEDERAALNRCVAAIKKHSGALAAGIFGVCATGTVRPLAAVGASCHGAAQRCSTLGQPIYLERVSNGFQAALPIRYLGRVIGALACRWSADGPLRAVDGVNATKTMEFCSAAATACAPLTYMLLDPGETREGGPIDAQPELIGTSRAMDDVRRAITRAGGAPFTVLIDGESGSGKELVARAIHRTSCRRERNFSAMNCAAMPEDLVDAELFGHAKGAFTGASTERLGLFESADQGTVFLDEVGELSLRAQAKLLRVIQEGEIRRLGESFTRPIDARLIAATNRSLHAEVEAGRFRQDLLYRLDVIRISVPPLRERIDDIPLLAARFWRQAADRIGSKAVLGPATLSALARYDWPGNVRELQNVLTAMAVAVPAHGVVSASYMPAAIARATHAEGLESLDMARVRFEERFVRAALARTAGHRAQAAAALGVTRQGLAKLMQRLGIDV
jgi:transcriptional regulator with AAA-type ATPase domain